MKATRDFIEYWLNPRTEQELLTIDERFFEMAHSEGVSFEIVSAYIRAMPYEDFLRTLYWEVVSEYVRIKQEFRCGLCFKQYRRLPVHHKSYKIHGMEHARTDALVALCNSCHERFHAIGAHRVLEAS